MTSNQIQMIIPVVLYVLVCMIFAIMSGRSQMRSTEIRDEKKRFSNNFFAAGRSLGGFVLGERSRAFVVTVVFGRGTTVGVVITAAPTLVGPPPIVGGILLVLVPRLFLGEIVLVTIVLDEVAVPILLFLLLSHGIPPLRPGHSPLVKAHSQWEGFFGSEFSVL